MLSQIIDKYSTNNIIEITEEVVDFYNQQVGSKNGESFKTANALANQLRKLIKSKDVEINTYYI